jgi:hypothetical protein
MSDHDIVVPFTRLERFAIFLGILLLFGGMTVLYLSPNIREGGEQFALAAAIATLAGAGLCAFCYIFNAVRRW